MKNILKQKTLYIAILSIVLAVATIFLQNLTTYNNSMVSKLESATNSQDMSKLSSIVTPDQAAYLETMSAAADLMNDYLDNDTMSSLMGMAGIEEDKNAGQYVFLPAREEVNSRGEKIVHYFMVPKSTSNSLRTDSLKIVKIEGKEYLDY